MIQYKKAIITAVDVTNKVVLARVDFNVPISGGEISDDTRIAVSLPMIRDLIDRGAKQIILLSHMGRPEGPSEALSLKPVKDRLEALLGLRIGFSEPTEAFLASEQVVLCENVRFWPGEVNNDMEFAQKLVTATGAELFVQDGLSVCHRSSATVEAITHLLPSYASASLVREYEAITGFVEKAARPLVTILGGAKISDKLGFAKQMIKVSDQIFFGGALATTFLRADGKPVGSSLVEYDQEEKIAEIKQVAQNEGKAIFLPIDVKTADNEQAMLAGNKLVDAVIGTDKILDIGESSSMVLGQLIANAGAVIWNGPVGYTENPVFEGGSERIVNTLVASQKPALVGGGTTLSFVHKEHPDLKYDGLILSTAGGAMLDLLAEGHLIGVDCLLDT